jgi:hypothetical protein
MMKKAGSVFKYIFLFIIFLGIGVAIGIYGTKKYMESKKKDEPVEEVVPEKEVVITNITDDSTYTAIVNELYANLVKNPAFYSSKGFNITEASNEVKLSLVYYYIVANKMDSVDTLPSSWEGTYCVFNEGLNSFIVDSAGAGCTVSYVPVATINETYKKLFGDTGLEMVATFPANEYKTCVLVGESYTCGRVTGTIYNGSLQPKMDVLKVEKYNDDIVITEKGYLYDNRSNLTTPDKNYYLHSSDSTDYYFELKSSDNFYFIHTFVKNEDGSYTYLKTTTETKKDN